MPNQILLGRDYKYGAYFDIVSHNKLQYANLSLPETNTIINYENNIKYYGKIYNLINIKFNLLEDDNILIITEDGLNFSETILFDTYVDSMVDDEQEFFDFIESQGIDFDKDRVITPYIV